MKTIKIQQQYKIQEQIKHNNRMTNNNNFKNPTTREIQTQQQISTRITTKIQEHHHRRQSVLQAKNELAHLFIHRLTCTLPHLHTPRLL